MGDNIEVSAHWNKLSSGLLVWIRGALLLQKVLLFDFSKAIDRMPPDIAVAKLLSLNVSPSGETEKLPKVSEITQTNLVIAIKGQSFAYYTGMRL